MGNKVKFKLKTAYYAKATIDANGTVTYAAPVRLSGAVSLSLSAEGDITALKADGIDYYVSNTNNGYSGDLELALIPENFRVDCLGEVLDANNVLIEKNTANIAPFAFLCEFEGDAKNIRHALYMCYASRPSVEGENPDTKEAKTESLTIKCVPREDGTVKSKSGDDVNPTAYANWYTAVYEPGQTELGQLYIDVIAGTTSTKTKVEAVVGEGAGTLMYKTAASLTKPLFGDSSTGYTALTVNTDITTTSGHKIVVVEAVDSKIIASSDVATVVVGA